VELALELAGWLEFGGRGRLELVGDDRLVNYLGNLGKKRVNI